MICPSVVTVAGICNSVSGGVFFDMSVANIGGVKARVVNRKQVDVVALRSDHSGYPGMR